MAEYQVMWIEVKPTSKGGEYKSLTLQGKENKYPDKFVSMWSNHPLYAEIAAGQTIDIELDVTEGKINPKSGLPYKNKSVRNPDTPPKASQTLKKAPTTNESPRVGNLTEFKVIPMLEAIYGRLGLIMEQMEIEPDNKADKKDYPAHKPTDFDEINS